VGRGKKEAAPEKKPLGVSMGKIEINFRGGGTEKQGHYQGEE